MPGLAVACCSGPHSCHGSATQAWFGRGLLLWPALVSWIRYTSLVWSWPVALARTHVMDPHHKHTAYLHDPCKRAGLLQRGRGALWRRNGTRHTPRHTIVSYTPTHVLRARAAVHMCMCRRHARVTRVTWPHTAAAAAAAAPAPSLPALSAHETPPRPASPAHHQDLDLTLTTPRHPPTPAFAHIAHSSCLEGALQAPEGGVGLGVDGLPARVHLPLAHRLKRVRQVGVDRGLR